jgi:hypothetical protein
MLGVPLGDKAFTSDYVKGDLLTRLKPVLERLEAFEDTQAALYLLRVSFSIVRATHFMRTTPLDHWREHAETFDTNLRNTVETILAVKMTEPVRKQASLTPRLGGLGFRRAVDHADLAFHASWHEALAISKEHWDRPDGVPETYTSQSDASLKFDEAVHTSLVQDAINAGQLREAQRLKRCAQPHSGGFITAMPSRHDGADTIMKPKTFRTAVYYRLGVPILDQEIPCPLCMQPINVFGDHATCCSKSGDLIVRHNAMRNLVESIARDGLLSPVLEKKGILGSAPGRRPGDVTIPQWSGQRALALDIAVTSPLNDTNVDSRNPCEEYANNRKHRKYDKDFKDSDHDFGTIVWETLGAVNEEGESYLRQIMRFASTRQGCEHSSYCGRMWARLSCCLQREVAKEIDIRTNGQKYHDKLVSRSECAITSTPPLHPTP